MKKRNGSGRYIYLVLNYLISRDVVLIVRYLYCTKSILSLPKYVMYSNTFAPFCVCIKVLWSDPNERKRLVLSQATILNMRILGVWGGSLVQASDGSLALMGFMRRIIFAEKLFNFRI